MTASLDEKLRGVKWGEYKFKEIFNKIKQGRRLKKEDQIEGTIPFVMSGISNTGVVNHISNPVALFPKNAITIDIFGNTFYRNYAFGAGDDTGVYWNDEIIYSKNVMLFIAVAMQKTVLGKFSYGKKLRSSQSEDFTVKLPITNEGEIDFSFMEDFIAELEAERVAELEAYLKASGLDNYALTKEEEEVLAAYDQTVFKEYRTVEVFDIKNTFNILSSDIKRAGTVPYLCASADNNAVSGYVSYDEKYLEKGNCIFIGGKTFVVSYQANDFFSNDSHNLALYLKGQRPTKANQLYLATCVYKSLKWKYTWGDSVSKAKIVKDKVFLPVKNDHIDLETMETLISAVQKLVIKDVVLFADRRMVAAKAATAREQKEEKGNSGRKVSAYDEAENVALEKAAEELTLWNE